MKYPSPVRLASWSGVSCAPSGCAPRGIGLFGCFLGHAPPVVDGILVVSSRWLGAQIKTAGLLFVAEERLGVVLWRLSALLHSRTPVLSFAVTFFRARANSDKTNRGILTPTQSQPRRDLVVGCGGGAQPRKNCFLAPWPLLSASPGACCDVPPERRGSRGLFAL